MSVRVYTSSPRNQLQMHLLNDMPVLMSYALKTPVWAQYAPAWGRILIDSGAYSALNPNNPAVDIATYIGWAAQWHWADAVAGLDDIRGDWRLSLKNYERFPKGFPTYHPGADPPELLDELIPMARERGGWIGVGLVPNDAGSRAGQETNVREALDRLADSDLHVHGWALGQYLHLPGIHSFDSTTPLRQAMALRARGGCAHLTYGECIEIEVKRLQRQRRMPKSDSLQIEMIK
jgi:hypothetical protein